jgi:hypothetical protein
VQYKECHAYNPSTKWLQPRLMRFVYCGYITFWDENHPLMFIRRLNWTMYCAVLCSGIAKVLCHCVIWSRAKFQTCQPLHWVVEIVSCYLNSREIDWKIVRLFQQSLCLHFCVQNIELYSTTIYIFKLLEYNKWSRNNNQAFQELACVTALRESRNIVKLFDSLYHKKWAPLCTCADRTVDHLYIKGLVSHQEFAGSNSCWRPFFGTNRLDDLESFYNPSYHLLQSVKSANHIDKERCLRPYTK